jgi:hypothetical protein
MHITIDQLLVGFRAKLTTNALGRFLGLPPAEVRARIGALTTDEEAHIKEALEGNMLSLLEQNILTFESRPHRNAAEYRRGVQENFTENAVMYEVLLKSIVSRDEARDFAPAAVDRLRAEFAQGSRSV